jgi:hypothetical protein
MLESLTIALIDLDVGVYKSVPIIVDVIIYIVLFFGITKAFFKDEYSLSARLGITALMVSAFLFFELMTKKNLLDTTGYLSIAVAVLAGAALYFIVNGEMLGRVGSVGVSLLFALVMSVIMHPDLFAKAGIFVNIVTAACVIYTLARIVLYIWRVFNITEEKI